MHYLRRASIIALCLAINISTRWTPPRRLRQRQFHRHPNRVGIELGAKVVNARSPNRCSTNHFPRRMLFQYRRDSISVLPLPIRQCLRRHPRPRSSSVRSVHPRRHMRTAPGARATRLRTISSGQSSGVFGDQGGGGGESAPFEISKLLNSWPEPRVRVPSAPPVISFKINKLQY
jgi:hypothetical protein